MSVKFDSSSLKGAEESTLHLLPCEIESDGNAKVQQYFTPTITKGGRYLYLNITVTHTETQLNVIWLIIIII